MSSYRFTAARGLLNAPTFDSNNECFCVSNDTALSENGFCSLDGVLDISKCHNGVPLVLSLPHFLYSDPLLIHSSKGINPDVSKHQSYLDVEPVSNETDWEREDENRVWNLMINRYQLEIGKDDSIEKSWTRKLMSIEISSPEENMNKSKG